ncbi:RsmD family RNA methyltransferase [Nannocystis pusilla]|uniref:RsmD family RNA methyltransferase n=1 Tax=Nannocystis pusilla TaxID=889268 RepID=UPI003B813DDC
MLAPRTWPFRQVPSSSRRPRRPRTGPWSSAWWRWPTRAAARCSSCSPAAATSRALAREAAEVVAVEEDRGSASALLRLAKKALASRQAKVEVRRLDATRALSRYAAEGRSFDRVVLDPPRSGLGLHGARALARVASGRTVFVACDPATLARDLEPMLEAGHRAASALAIDMMPMTPEVEVIVALDAPRERS